MLNQLLGGHYLVVQTLGEGGLAKTYIAEDHHRPGHPKCAVKYLKPASNDPAFLPIARRLFNKEAEILEKIGQYDQIPRLLAYFEEKKEFYLVQEFIEGHTLSAELPLGHRWSENKVIQMLQDVLQILKFVHSYGVIHRDIKPSNLIRRQKDNRLVLIDFGAVKQVRNPGITTHASLTQKTISIGTQGYIPTEQVRGKPRLNSDIYAVGMIGIQALTGIHPFNLQEDAEGEIIWQNRAEVSDELAAILTTMVRYHFKERYQSATEVLHALDPLAHYYTPIQSTSGTKQRTPEVAPKPEISATKVSLDVKNQDAEAVSNPKLGETKVALDFKQSTPDLASEKKERHSKVSSADSLASLKDFELSQANVFVHLKKYRLLIGAGIISVLVGIFMGYAYVAHRQSYSQAQEDLEQIEELKADKEYQECMQQAKIFPRAHSDLHTKAETLLNECHQQSYSQAQEDLEQIEELKTDKEYQECIQQAEIFPRAHSDLHTKAETLLGECHQQSYLQAQEALETIEVLKADEEYQECIQQAKIFPRAHSNLYAKAETLLDECKQQLADARKLLEGSGGIDYPQLSNYLKAGYWREADLETHRVMLKANKGGNLTKESIKNFPCKNLKSINDLWQKYSDGRFGFSVQNKEYQNLGKSINPLGDKLGWRRGDWMTYNYLWEKFHPNVPAGHLPARIFRIEKGAGMWYHAHIRKILDRTNSCNL